MGGRGITLHARKIIVTRLENKEEAERVLERLKDLINKTYERRTEIEPSTKSRAKLTVIEVYKLLPKTNCRECGEPTCMAFATRLVSEELHIAKCKSLFADGQRENREKLLKLLSEAGYGMEGEVIAQ